MQARIDSLMMDLAESRQSFSDDLECTERIIVERDSLIDQLIREYDRLYQGLRTAESANDSLLHQSAKLRAQLSGGRAKGRLLVDEYEQRLRVAIQTIETLRSADETAPAPLKRAA